MGRDAVRLGIKGWLTGQVDGLNTVFGTFPRPSVPPESYTAGCAPGTASGAIGILFIAREVETRLTVPAGGGWKRIEYQVDLDVFHRSAAPSADDSMRSFDLTIDAAKARIRLDPTMGGIFFQAGEGDFVRFDGEYGEPVLDGDLVQTWGRLTFNVTEMIQA